MPNAKKPMPKRSVLPIGTVVLKRYEIIKCIHSRGMANVYLVKDSTLGKSWCLKEIRKDEAGKYNQEYVSLLQEANIMRGLNHVNIPRITTIEEDGNSLFIVEDFIEGKSLGAVIRDYPSGLPMKLAVPWMKQMAQIISYLHTLPNPIFYRDMKPDNFMVQSDGTIKLLDFGISIEVKAPGQKIEKAMGTKGYAAPEQKKSGNVIDLRSDIYGLGMTYYHMLTGICPTPPKDAPKNDLPQLPEIRVKNPEISPGIEKIVSKCKQESPDDRYQSCSELLDDLSNYEKLDDGYRTGIRRKVQTTAVLFFMSLALIISSIIPYSLDQAQSSEAYDKAVQVAEQSGRTEDYESALDLNAVKIGPYAGFVDSMKVDAVFSKEEEQSLLNYINPNLQELKDQNGYGDLAYEIGKLYWYYYQGESNNEGQILSIKWFADARDNNCNPELSEVYNKLGMFQRDIAKSITESEDAGMYSEYWHNLVEIQDSASGEIVTLQTHLSLANCISSYAYNLKKDGISYEDVSNEIDVLKRFLNSVEIDDASNDTVKSIYATLNKIVPTLQDKVDIVYNATNSIQSNTEKDESSTLSGGEES